MRILYSHYLAEDSHPAVLMVEAIAKELRKQGHEVFVHRSSLLTPDASPASKPLGSARKRRAGKLRNALWFLRALSRNRPMLARDLEAIDRIKPDLVLARQDAYCFSMPVAARRRNIPLVTYADAPTAYETRQYGRADGRFHPPFLVEAIERWTLRVSREVVTVSEPAGRILESYHCGTPIHVISNGIAPERFPRLSKEERAEGRAALGLTAPVVACFAGSFKAFHGIDKLRDLILATSYRNDLQWLLIGDGPKRLEIEEALAGRASAVFLGRRPSEEVGRLLGLADIAAAPHPLVEGEFYFCPLKILEYMAAGCAVLASRQGDIPTILDGGQAGITISDPSTEVWARALLDILDRADYREILGESARQRALAQYTWEQTAKHVEKVLINSAVPNFSVSR